MAVVFPRKGNKLWPLPIGYHGLSKEGQRLARVNACRIGGRPDLEVAAWDFFRRTYLFPMPKGFFYNHGTVKSPDAHRRWIKFWYSHQMTVLAAPRGFAKSTLLREDALRSIVANPYYRVIGFYSTLQKVTENFGTIMDQITDNELIVNDFGKLKPKRGYGSWNHHYIKLSNGSSLLGIPIKGASLGGRPNKLYFDDVEKTDELIETPSEHIEGYRAFVLNVVIPMSTSAGMWIRLVNTNYNRRTFSWWLHTTKDPQITKHWGRLSEAAEWNNPETGETDYLWGEYFTPAFLEEKKSQMGIAYSANYLNCPITESDRILSRHPLLNNYSFANQDERALQDPFISEAQIVSHAVVGWKEGGPEIKELVRPWKSVIGGMRRYIMVDYAHKVSKNADFSVVHVIGHENSTAYRDTVWSLDCWMGRVQREELVRRIYLMAARWAVCLIGIEKYNLPVQEEFYKRASLDLPTMFADGATIPRIIPISWPTTVKKAEKIKGLEWRFLHYRMKLPTDREENPAYRALNYQVENFTEDMGLLPFDDVLDTLSMIQKVGVPRGVPLVPDSIPQGVDLLAHLSRGEFVHEDTGIPILSGLSFQDIPDSVLDDMRDRQYERLEDDNAREDESVIWHQTY